LRNYFELNITFHNYNTRNINDMRVNSRLSQKCIKFKAATVWNKLPLKIKEQRSINTFKAQLNT